MDDGLKYQFKRVLDAIPGEFTRRINHLEELHSDFGFQEFWDMAEDLRSVKKNFFYRRKRYREIGTDEEISKYMKTVHDIMIKFMEVDERTMKLLSED